MAKKNRKRSKRKKKRKNRGKQNRQGVDIPPDTMGEIFQRLPIESLIKCTSVCKRWNSFITGNTFISSHLQHTIPGSNQKGAIFLRLDRARRWENPCFVDGEFYSPYSDDKPSDHFEFLRSPFFDLYQNRCDSTVVGTCNGLVCYAYCFYPTPHILIWNPSIRKYLLFPSPSVTPMNCKPEHIRRWLSFGFGFDSTNQDFKVVRLVSLYNEQDTPQIIWYCKVFFLAATLQVEVYSLADRSWRSITVGLPQLVIPRSTMSEVRQVFVNDAVHWFATRKRCDGKIENFILSFDVVKEIFGELSLPPHLKGTPDLVSILGGGNSIAVLHTCTKRNQTPPFYSATTTWLYTIWVMKEYGNVESWTKVFRCDSESYGSITKVLAFSSSGKVAFRHFDEDIAIVDPETGLVKHLGDRKCMDAFAVGPYVESLFLIGKQSDVLSF